MHLLVTAGPTREPLDAVRYLSNRSSGTLGIAIANAAADAGHDATLLLGPVSQPLNLHKKVTLLRFETVSELQTLLQEHFPSADALVMAAAVGDYRLAEPMPGKAERNKGDLTLKLTATPDLVSEVAKTKRDGQKVIAFALEERDQLEARARSKMQRKGVDAIVANPLETMDADDIEARFISVDGAIQRLASMSKADFATWLVRRLEAM